MGSQHTNTGKVSDEDYKIYLESIETLAKVPFDDFRERTTLVEPISRDYICRLLELDGWAYVEENCGGVWFEKDNKQIRVDDKPMDC